MKHAHLSILFITAVTTAALAQQANRPYRLQSVDLKQRVIWGAELKLPDGTGLAFGGQDQQADDGRPHTRVLKDGKWVAIHMQLIKAMGKRHRGHESMVMMRDSIKRLAARERHRYFRGDRIDDKQREIEWEAYMNECATIRHTMARARSLHFPLISDMSPDHVQNNIERAKTYLRQAMTAFPETSKFGFSSTRIKAFHQSQILLERAADMVAAEPPARAMICGNRRKDESGPRSQTIVYDKRTDLYLIFGGDHLDYLTNDTWVFDPKGPRWELRHPEGAPPPRANHRLEANGDGTITMTGGYTYASNTDYLGGQYIDLNDGKWTYDIAKNEWSGGGKLVSPVSRTYRKGPFHPDYYLQGDKPDAAKFQAWLKKIPENQWVATNPPYRPRLNRDWGTARIDPSRDMMLRWSGGHSAHGGTDVPHFHFATNRWELAFPVEFPLGQLYSNTSYPNGFNFNMRPWMTGHTYQNYAFDPPSKMMIKAGRPKHFYVYDPDVADWIGRGVKPKAMQYNSCFYTLTCIATPRGVICWDKQGRVHRYSHKDSDWKELELTGDKLPGAYVDNSSIVYDSKRDRVLMFNTLGYGKPFDGSVHSLDLKTDKVTTIKPPNTQLVARFNTIDKSVYDAKNDLVLMGTFLRGDKDDKTIKRTQTPAFDCATNRWITLDIGYELGKRYGRTTRQFPHTRSDGLMYDPKRQLIWGTDTNSQVYVLRLNAKR